MRYPKYKNSGIDWIGEIPVEWDVKRGKDVLKITSGFPADSNLFDIDGTGIPLIRIRDINNIATEVTYVGSDYSKEFIINPGDLLVGMDGDFNTANWKGGVALLNQRVCKIESGKLEHRYLSYIVTFPLLEINAKKVLTTVKHLAASDLYEMSLPLPPLSEQQVIADYLDKKTAEIDGQVELLEKKVEKYEQLKKSLISRTVTRGLNKDVRLKDSGIDWIGEIPEGWDVKRGKDVLKITSGFPADSNLFDIDGTGIPLIRIRDINNITTEVTYVGSDYSKEFIINPGDLLVGMDGDFNTANWKGGVALLNQRVCKIESRKLEHRYLSYIVTFPLLEINAKKVLTTVKHLAASDLYEMSLPLPPLAEQQAIADYLDKKTAEIDTTIAQTKQQIENYKRLRKSLINEVVTGQRQIKVQQ